MKYKNETGRAAAALLALVCCTLPARAAESEMLVPVGQTVGIELRCDGVVVSGLAEIETPDGAVCPAREADVRPGDRILRLNGEAVHTVPEFMAAAERFTGETVTLEARRGGETLELTVTPRESAEGKRQLGLWLRDSVHGVGTVTYWDPATGEYGALGHGVSLPEGLGLLDAEEGNITAATVVDVVSGARGEPGELCGVPDPEQVLGTVESNTPQGIFGTAEAPLSDREPVPVAGESELRPGEATILATVDETGPREFSAKITRVDHSGDGKRLFTIVVTDPELLRLTGGIVQGMSGSPVLQNGKLVGAVTHVLVNEPDKGYGISMENMLAAARGLSEAA